MQKRRIYIIAFFQSAVGTLQTLVIALGAGLGIRGAINLMEGYGNDNSGAKSQGMKQMTAQGAQLSNIQITDQNIKSFDRVARKYGIDYSLKKDISVDPPKYLVFFKAKDVDVMTAALGWKDYFQNDFEFEGDYSMIYSQWGKAYHLLLSKQGKIPRMFSDTYPLAGGGEKTNQVIKTCKNIEKNIQIYHPEVRIMFVPGSHLSSTTYENEYYEDVCMGKLYWEHNIPLRNKKWNPNIRKLW